MTIHRMPSFLLLLVSSSLVHTRQAIAAPPPAASDQSMTQVTSVSQLSDVRPTDWAFQALQSLVERYGCIAGYPDRTYRGNRAITRYEFAAGLNACMDRVNELIAAATADMASKEDLACKKNSPPNWQPYAVGSMASKPKSPPWRNNSSPPRRS
jgi:hypothetical protein